MAQPTATRRDLMKFGTSAAAYAAGAALVAGGVALAGEAKSEAPATLPPIVEKSLADPLEPFAHAWLTQWTEKGGSVLTTGDGDFHFGWAEYHGSPAYRSDEKANQTRRANGWSNDLIERYANWDRGCYDGSMRALLDMLKAVPGGVAAVKAVVAADRRAGFMPSMREVQA